jgi:hypothetical protein
MVNQEINMNRCALPLLAGWLAIGLSILTGCGNKTSSESGAQSAEDAKLNEFKGTSKRNMYEMVNAMTESRTQAVYDKKGQVDKRSDALPIGIYAADGKTIGLSWRVAILPALKQDEIYKQFKLDEPWDGPNNKKLIAKMPQIFAAPGKAEAEGMTHYRSFSGKETMMPPPEPGKPAMRVPGLNYPFGISDGTFTTALIVEAAEPVIWTKPEELEFDRQKPLPKLGGVFADGYHIAFASAGVYFFKTGSLSDETLKAMITPAGGENFPLPEEMSDHK